MNKTFRTSHSSGLCFSINNFHWKKWISIQDFSFSPLTPASCLLSSKACKKEKKKKLSLPAFLCMLAFSQLLILCKYFMTYLSMLMTVILMVAFILKYKTLTYTCVCVCVFLKRSRHIWYMDSGNPKPDIHLSITDIDFKLPHWSQKNYFIFIKALLQRKFSP